VPVVQSQLIDRLIQQLDAQPRDQIGPTVQAKENVLKDSLLKLRQGIDTYARDRHHAPQSLLDLVANGYLQSIPIDPTTGSNQTWQVVMESPANSVDRNAPGIFDVHSGSDATSPDGTRYAGW
jgi:general secretion pathway protein G